MWMLQSKAKRRQLSIPFKQNTFISLIFTYLFDSHSGEHPFIAKYAPVGHNAEVRIALASAQSEHFVLCPFDGIIYQHVHYRILNKKSLRESN